jgi:N-glycosylase/DNA lyase
MAGPARRDAVTVAVVLLPIDQPLDLATTLSSGQCFRWRSTDDAEWVGVLDNNVVRLRMTSGGLEVASEASSPSQMAAQVLSYLRMDDDLIAIQRRLSRDTQVASSIAAYPGLRLLRQDPWETLAAFILSSVSNIPRIGRTIELIATTLGDPVSLGGVVRHTFPSPERLAQVGEAELRRLGCGFRAPYLASAAQAVASGHPALEQLRQRPYEEVRQALTALDGVGDKVADCVMLFSLNRMEAFPVDRWVQRVLEQWYDTGSMKRYSDARAWAWGRFGADAGYANQYLFWRRRQVQGTTLDPHAGFHRAG